MELLLSHRLSFSQYKKEAVPESPVLTQNTKGEVSGEDLQSSSS